MILERYVELARERWTGHRPPADRLRHLLETLHWVYRAQDARPDRGVSHSYVLGRGWTRSYPETTGYLIPSLLNWSAATGDEDARRRALDMAAWELEVQLENGAIPDLSEGKPVVFDTGQVLFGFLAAASESGDERYLAAARRASEWLIAAMDEDGVWSRHGGPGTGPVVYNARTAWALIEAGRRLGEERFVSRARDFLNWTLTQEEAESGWFHHNCLNDPERPLLHTIAYTAQGQLESGLLLEDPRWVEAARRTARALTGTVEEDGRMSGRFDRTWKPAASWSCLTGVAQTVLVWRRLDGDGFGDTTEKALDYLLSVHDVSSKNPGLRGGVRGSHPVNGGYCRYRIPNWAAKFLIDALLSERALARHPG